MLQSVGAALERHGQSMAQIQPRAQSQKARRENSAKNRMPFVRRHVDSHTYPTFDEFREAKRSDMDTRRFKRVIPILATANALERKLNYTYGAILITYIPTRRRIAGGNSANRSTSS